MCWFLGIFSEKILTDEYLVVNDKIKLYIANATGYQKICVPNKSYYTINDCGCSCNIHKDEENVRSNVLKNLFAQLPGHGTSEVFFVWLGDKIPYDTDNYERIKIMLPNIEINKQDFINLYPNIEDNTVYTLI